MSQITKTFTLHNGVQIPNVGFGVFMIPDGENTYNSVTNCIKAGYRHIDTAYAYHNEKSVGKAVRESGLKREEIFVTTKVIMEKMGYDNTLENFEESMQNLGLETVDLYLIHWPLPMKRGLAVDTWKAMEKLYKDGRVRAIGVSNFSISKLCEIMDKCEIVPMVNQIEMSPYNTQVELVKFCRENNIVVEAWCPLGRAAMLSQPTFVELAKKYNKTAAQIVLRWNLQRGIVPLPRSENPVHIRENLDLYDFEISQEDMDKINALDCGMRIGPDPELFAGSRDQFRGMVDNFQTYFKNK